MKVLNNLYFNIKSKINNNKKRENKSNITSHSNLNNYELNTNSDINLLLSDNYLNNSPNINRNQNNKIELFEDLKKIKVDQNKEVISHESCLIKRKFLDTWNFVTNPEKVSEILPIVGKNYKRYGCPLKIGTFWKFFKEKENKIIFLKLTDLYMKKQRNCWIYAMEVIGSEKYGNMQSFQIKVTKVGENYSQVSVTHIFKNSTNKNFIKVIGFNKIDSLKKLKKFLETENAK